MDRTDQSRHFALLAALGWVAAGSLATLPHARAQSDSSDWSAAAAAANLRDGRLLLLRTAEFDPLVEARALPEALTWEAVDGRAREVADPDYYFVQFVSKVTPTDREAFAAIGVTPIGYVPNNAFLVRAPAAALTALREWPRVRAIVRCEPADRLDQELLARAEAAVAAGRGSLDVMIQLFPGCDTGTATRELFLAGAEFSEIRSTEVGAGVKVRLLARVPAERLVELAHVRDVQWIQPQSKAVLRNDTTNWVLQSNTSGSLPVWANGVLGDGVIIGHIDDPIDLDACFFDDPAVSSPGPTHRKIVSHHGSYSNPGSHGTHTAGTSAGDQKPINGVLDDNGVAYKSRIAHTNLDLIDSGNYRAKLNELYGDGARLFTNSWGDDSTTSYDAWCVDIDDMIWDNQDALICFAVTNQSNLKNPENAKNVLAVGATEQSPNQSQHCYGGKGPTSDGRRKPEIFAPGCSIHSARSNSTCSTTTMSGTSMACPAITGSAALVKHYFEAGYWPSGAANVNDAFAPSGSLLKAVLINSARDMTGETGYPSTVEGWGRLLLDHSLYFAGDARQMWLADVSVADGFAAPGATHTWYVNVYNSASELNFCLVFPDAAGTVNSSQPVVNDLDLEVLAPDGRLYRGNVFSSSFSTIGGAADPLNNVERVRLAAPVLGWYVVTVDATNVTTSKAQSYALVASGNLDPPAAGGFATYGSGTAGTGGFVPTIALSGSSSIGDDVSLTISNGLGGGTALLVMGFARDIAPFAGGQLLVAAPWTTFTLGLDGTAGVGGDGDLVVTDTLPADPTLVGVVVDFQVLVADRAAVKKLALSNGAELTIGS
ncbi:MAG: hypothetical protein EXS13_05480 [Planctomycetes bacterium]|nr:hypothetical protein [Planctomycetota bacterium]